MAALDPAIAFNFNLGAEVGCDQTLLLRAQLTPGENFFAQLAMLLRSFTTFVLDFVDTPGLAACEVPFCHGAIVPCRSEGVQRSRNL